MLLPNQIIKLMNQPDSWHANIDLRNSKKTVCKFLVEKILSANEIRNSY